MSGVAFKSNPTEKVGNKVSNKQDLYRWSLRGGSTPGERGGGEKKTARADQLKISTVNRKDCRLHSDLGLV
jgi:hypothetical protein